ncbi:Renin receptor [Nymphon striatum]|nr:Renin receptor [Nymphon striatum]
MMCYHSPRISSDLLMTLEIELLASHLLLPTFVSCDEKLYLSIPNSVLLNPSITSIRSSQLSNIILNTLGFTVPAGEIWSGIQRTQPFNHPKAAIVIDIVGDSAFSLPQSTNEKSFDLIHTAQCSAQQVAAILDSDDEETLGFDEDYPSDELKTDSDDTVDNDNDSESDSDNDNPVDRLPDEGIAKIHEAVSCHFSNELFGKKYIDIGLWNQNQIPFVKADNPDLLGGITDDFDKFLQDAIKDSALNASIVAASDKTLITVRDLYVFRINSFLSVLQTDQRDAASAVLKKCLEYIQENFKKAYNGQIIFLTEVVDAENSRKTRSLLQADSADPAVAVPAAATTAAAAAAPKITTTTKATTTNKAPPTTKATPNPDKTLYNLAKQYTGEYQVTFAIVLFLVILLTFTTLAISLVMWNMDPGRDSIIYRMTSQRVKID